jgi:hypothetical protein
MTIESVNEIIIRDERTPWLHVHSAYDEMPLTIEAFRVLCHFARRANNETKETKTTYKNIGETCFKATYPNSAPNTLRRRAIKAVSELEGFGLVRKEPWYTDGGDLLGNIFILTHTTSWKLDFDPSMTNNSLVRGVAGVTSDADSTSDTDDTEECDQLHQGVPQDSPRGDAGRTEYKGTPLRKSKKEILEGNPFSCAEGGNDNRPQDEVTTGSVDSIHPLGSDSSASHSESKSSIVKTYEYQIFLDVYNENKPDRWSKVEKLTPTRIKMLDRLIKDYGDKSLTMLQRALVGAKRSHFWNGLDYKFDYLYREKGSNGENGDKITGLAEGVPEEDLYSERINLTQSGVEIMDDYKRMKAALAMFEQEAS